MIQGELESSLQLPVVWLPLVRAGSHRQKKYHMVPKSDFETCLTPQLGLGPNCSVVLIAQVVPGCSPQACDEQLHWLRAGFPLQDANLGASGPYSL